MTKWTKEQETAITARGKNLLVSAAAGSGKTAVLVQRIIELVLRDHVDIDRLLIVTFTNAAAGEMRERIMSALAREAEKEGADSEHIRRQITLLSKSFITTMHSFCIDVVRSNFHIIDIDPSFRIADVAESAILIQESADELFEECYKKAHPDFIELVEGFGGNREDAKLQELMLSMYGFIQSQPYPLEWLEQSVESLNVGADDIEGTSWGRTIAESFRSELEGAMDILRQAGSICALPGGPSEYAATLQADMENVAALRASLESGLSSFYAVMPQIKHQRLATIKKERKDEIDERLQEDAKKLRDSYKKLIDTMKSDVEGTTLQEHARQLQRMHPLMKYLSGMIGEFDGIYSAKKLERGLLDFNDLEHYALKALESDEVRKELSGRFEYIFVDEYQDSNIVQETIIGRIKRGDNLFQVGDVKQSIYRFRLADPTLFIEKYETYSKDGSTKDLRIDLSKNFRSREEILGSINFIFRQIMSKSLGEIDYDEEAFLYKGTEFEECMGSPVEINIVQKGSDGLDVGSELEEMSDIEAEARLTASRIKEIVGGMTYDPKLRAYRQIEYRDIVILLRTVKNWASVFTQVFREEGIPVYSDESSGYFDTVEMQIFINLLRLIDNKRQDIPLISVMRSPVGGFSIEELVQVRLASRQSSYHEALEDYVSSCDDELAEKIRLFTGRLDEWADESRMMRLDEFIWKLLVDTGYYYYVGAMPGGEQRQANLRILVERAGQLEKSTISGLFNFIRFIDRMLRSSSDMGSAKVLSENENIVRIMSIHKSKGLEFPVVVMAGLGKKFNLRDSSSEIVLHKDLGIGPRYVEPQLRFYRRTLPQIAIKKRIDIESLSEEMRILYVGMTRAVDRLIMIGSVRDVESSAKKWCRPLGTYSLSSALGFMDWICMAAVRHKDALALRELCENEQLHVLSDGLSSFEVRLLDRTHVSITEVERRMRAERFEKELMDLKENPKSGAFSELISTRFSWKYPHAETVSIPSKISVTQLSRISKEGYEGSAYSIPSLSKSPSFVEGKKGFTAAEKGSINHFVMRHIDMQRTASEEDIMLQVQELVSRELLSQEEAQAVQAGMIRGFFRSEIGERLRKAQESHREVPFVIQRKACEVMPELEGCEDPILIQGIVDCYFQEDGELVLLDYKTDRAQEGIEESAAQKYRAQLELYREALEKLTGMKVKEAYIYLLSISKQVRIL